MRIVFLIPNLGGGGAERVASLLCNQWVEQGQHIDLVTWEQEHAIAHYPLSEQINLHRLALDQPTTSLLSFVRKNIRRVMDMRKKLEELAPDIVISFLTEANVVCALAAKMSGLPCILAERIHPDAPIVSKAQRLMRRWTYPLASQICVQTDDIAAWYRKNLNLSPTTIPNPIDLAAYGPWSPESAPETEEVPKRIIAVGRLEHQKGFDCLISAFAQVAQDHPGWQIHIYGEGGLKQDLQSQIDELKLTQRVHLEGLSHDIASVLKHADVMVHPARFEGFPNAIVEALASGCCVVATDCPGGTREILKDGRYGLLCSHDYLPETLAQALSDAQLRRQFKERARGAVVHLDLATIAQRWIVMAQNQIEAHALRQTKRIR